MNNADPEIDPLGNRKSVARFSKQADKLISGFESTSTIFITLGLLASILLIAFGVIRDESLIWSGCALGVLVGFYTAFHRVQMVLLRFMKATIDALMDIRKNTNSE